MNREEIKPGGLYALGARVWSEPDRGIVLDNRPHVIITDHRGGQPGGTRILRPDPKGRGYGRVNSRLDVRHDRGLPVLLASRTLGDTSDIELADLAAPLIAGGITGDATGRDVTSATHHFPVGVSIQVLRPQDVRTTWAAHLATVEAARASRDARATQIARDQQQALQARGRVLARLRELSITCEIPDSHNRHTGQPMAGPVTWQMLEAMIAGIEDIVRLDEQGIREYGTP